MVLTSRLEKAIRCSAWAHRNQKRKGTGLPYIIHPFGVMAIASEVTQDEDTLIACLLHDVLEDVPKEYPEEAIRTDFGNNVASIVKGVTKDTAISDWHERSRAYLQTLAKEAPDESIIVACSDKIHNLMAILDDHSSQGDEVWTIFKTGKDSQVWWYTSVRDVVRSRLPSLPILPRYEQLIKQLETITKKTPRSQKVLD